MKHWVALLLVWSLAFILAEAAGVAISSGLASITSEPLTVALGQAVTVMIRVVVVVFLAPLTGISLSRVYRSPPPSRIPLLLAVTAAVALLSYMVNLSTSPTIPKVIQYSNFIAGGATWTIPFTAAYYLSEIVLLNYLYVLAKSSWSLLGSPVIAANVFLIIGWASLHAITQHLVTAVFAVALVPIFYISYEYTGKSPVTPILLWFVTLAV